MFIWLLLGAALLYGLRRSGAVRALVTIAGFFLGIALVIVAVVVFLRVLLSAGIGLLVGGFVVQVASPLVGTGPALVLGLISFLVVGKRVLFGVLRPW